MMFSIVAVLGFCRQTAALLGADAKEIIFTSGATESNNLALKGVARFYKDRKKHIVTTVTVRFPNHRRSAWRWFDA
jgi:cysteine sulfinate desulfinase/cysteine desulfurase-like protein